MPSDRTLRHMAALYGANSDPWGHLTSSYEREKYGRTLEAIGDGRVRLGLEVGCGIGALTALLAPRCDRLVSLDCVPAALDRARRQVQEARHVEFIEGVAPNDLPAITPDLIVLSEVLYFLTRAEIDHLGAWVAACSAASAVTVVVSWKGETGEVHSGNASVEIFARTLHCWTHRRTDHGGYWIDTYFSPGHRAAIDIARAGWHSDLRSMVQ